MVDTGLFRLGVFSTAFLVQTAPLRDGQVFSQSQSAQGSSTASSSPSALQNTSNSEAVQRTPIGAGRVSRLNSTIDELSNTLSSVNRASDTASSILDTLKSFRASLQQSISQTANTQQRTVYNVADQNAQQTSTQTYSTTGTLASVLGGSETSAVDVTIGAQTTRINLSASDTSSDLVSKFGAVSGLQASLDSSNRLVLEATGRETFELRNVDGANTLTELGFTANRTETVSSENQVTDNALVIGTKDLRPFENEQAYALTSADAGLSVTVGSNETVTLTRRDVASLTEFITALDGISGLSSTLDENGQIQLEAENGETLDIRSTNNEMLDVLGLTANGTESVELTRTVQDNAQLTGTTNIRDIANLEVLAGTQDGASIDIQLGSAVEATSIAITSTTSGQDLLDSLNSIANVSASFTTEGALSIEATDGSTLTITDTFGSLTNDLGISENSTQIITTADTNAAYATSITGTVDISSGKLQDLAGVDEDAQFAIEVDGSAGPTTITINRNDRSSDLLSQLNAVANVSATLNGDGTLQISTDNGAGFSLTQESGLSLEGLGLVENIRNPSTIEAQITGTVDLGSGRLRDLANLESGDVFSITVDGTTTDLTIGNNTSAADLANQIDGLAGVTASVNAQGQLQITGENGNRIELREGTGDPLQGLGITLNDSEDLPTAGYTITAQATGNVALNRNDRLRDIDGAFALGNLQIDVTEDVGGVPTTTPNTIIINENSRVRDLVDQIDAISGISASLNADDQLEIIADSETTSFSLTNLVDDVLTPLGLSEGSYDPVVVPPGTETVAYASADSTVGPETRTVRVANASADISFRQENYTEDWGIVQQTATQRTETVESDSDYLRSEPTQVQTSRTITETVGRTSVLGSDDFDPVFQWKLARISIDNDFGQAVSRGAVLLTGTSMTLSNREGDRPSSEIFGKDISLSAMGLDGFEEILESGDIEASFAALDRAIFQAEQGVNQFNVGIGRIEADIRLTEKLIQQVASETIGLFNTGPATRVDAGNTGNQLAALQVALAGNNTDQLRAFF